MSAISNSALEYASYGWKVVIDHFIRQDGQCSCGKPECRSAGKHPRFNQWEQVASDDEETIVGWLDDFPESNIGVRLGECSGIIDIECDSPEAEKEIQRIFRGEPIITPTYSSGRGNHRIFKFRSDLPGSDQAVSKPGNIGLELRIGGGSKGAQSVFPPSQHYTGARYRWLPGLSPNEVEPQELPEHVVKAFWDLANMERPGDDTGRAPKKYDRFYAGERVRESIDGRDDHLISLAGKEVDLVVRAYGIKGLDDPLNYQRLLSILQAMNDSLCSPPLDQATVRAKLDQAIKMARSNDIKNHDPLNLGEYGLEIREDGEVFPGSWRAVCFKSEPPQIKLYAPILPDEFIALTPEDFDSPIKVHRAILSATGSVCLSDVPGKWERIWNGFSTKKATVRGLKAKLLDAAESEEALSDERRSAVVAGMILEQLERAALHEDGKELPTNGRPILMPDSSVYFQTGYLYNNLRFIGDVTRNEIVTILGYADVGEARKKSNRKTVYFRVANNMAINKLRIIAGFGEPIGYDEKHYRENKTMSLTLKTDVTT